MTPGRALSSYCLIRDALIVDLELRKVPALRELLVMVLWEWSQGRPLTIKHCILSYPVAEKIVRKHLRALVDAGHLEIVRSERDRRERLLKPSALTLERLERIDALLERQEGQALPAPRRRAEDIGFAPHPPYVSDIAAELEP